MSRVAIVTDTDASLPDAVAERFHIRQVPIVVQFDDEPLLAGVDVDDARLFARIDADGRLPTTSAPSPGQFVEAFKSAFDDGAESILCFNVSSEVSATYVAALTARESFPDRDITVVDTRSLSLGQGFMALAAAEAAQQGASRDECLVRATGVGQRTHLFAALSTVKYLAMSGRVGSIAAGMAGLLNIKPILTIRDGQLELLERIRTQKKAWARLIELTGKALNGRPIEQLGIVHVAAPYDAREFERRLRAALPCPSDILIGDLTPGLSVHTGAGLVGIAVVAG
jgi:DegV family protein with EDD domain